MERDNSLVVSIFAPLDPATNATVIDLRVRFFETDLMGIVHHASYLTYFEAGRVEWLRNRGVKYSDWASSGVHLPVVEAQVKYQSPARFDDELVVETRLVELRAVSMKYAYVIHRGATAIASGMTRLGCIDASHKLLRIPEEMREVLLSAERLR